MATRREKVILELEDDFSSEMARAAAATALLKRELNSLNGTSVQSSRVSKDIDRIGKSSVQADRSINQLTGRLRLFADLAAILGPSLVPIGAVGIPALTGLANQFGMAALAAGTTLVAFNGVGTALEAMNKAALEPTAENIEAARVAMTDIAPAAQDFVLKIRDMIPAFKDVRAAAAEGLFPGVVEGLDDIERLLPKVEGIMGEVGSVVGDLFADGAESLASGRWTEFFNYLESEARPTLTALGETLGNFTHGLSEMWMAFDPLNDDFSGWLLDVSKGFDSWSQGLAQTQGFQDFVAYIRENGPQVADTMGALGNALLQVVEAAAPLGGPVLAGIEALADVISTIADSDMGTPIMAAVGALALFNRTMAITSRLQKSSMAAGAAGGGMLAGGLLGGTPGSMRSQLAMIGKVPGAYKSVTAASRELTKAQAAQAKAGRSAVLAQSAFIPRADKIQSVRDYNAARNATAAAESKVALAQQRVSGTMREAATGFGKGAAAAAGLAVALSPLPEKFGLSNTASMALMGTMFAPGVGTAIGATAGLLLDVGAANDDVSASMQAAATQFKSANTFADMQTAIDGASSSFEEFQGYIHGDGPASFDPMRGLAMGKNFIEGLFGDSDVDEAKAQFRELQHEMVNTEVATSDLAVAMGADFTTATRDLSGATFGVIGEVEGVTVAAKDMEAAVLSAQPAMSNLGITMEDIKAAGGSERESLIGSIVNEIGRMDSASGKINDLRDALSGLDQAGLSTAASAQQFSSALGTILAPKFNLSAATDQWQLSLNELDSQLSDTSKTLEGNSTAAIQNRSAIRGLGENLTGVLTAQAEAGAGSQKLSRTLRRGVASILATGEAAGLSKAEVSAYAAELGLTPRLVRSLIKLEGAGAAAGEIGEVIGGLKNLDGWKANPSVRLGGVGAAVAGAGNVIGALQNVNGWHATPNVTLTGVGQAIGAAGNVIGALRNVDGTNANPNVEVQGVGAAVGGAAAVAGAINSIPGSRTSVITTIFRTVGSPAGAGGNAIAGAEGMIIPPGYAFASGGMMDRANKHEPMIAAGGPTRIWAEEETQGETYIPWANDHRRPRAKALLEHTAEQFGGEVQWFANGGTLNSRIVGDGGRRGNRQDLGPWEQFRRGMIGFRRALNMSINTMKKERDQRKSVVDGLRSERNELRSSVTDRFTSDLFGEDPWSTSSPLSAALGTIRGDIVEARAFNQDRAKIARFVKGDALDALLQGASNAQVDAFASSSRAELNNYERLFNQRQRIAANTGAAAGNAAFGAQLDRQERLLRQQNQQLKAANKRLERANKQREKGNKDRRGAPKLMSKGINGAARRGKLNQR